MSPIEILEAMQRKTIAVVGDPMVDEYVFGRVTRICPEAPVPVFVPERTERRQGGAANVSAQINALGCYALSLMPHTVSVKTRYMAGHHQLIRVDKDARYHPDEFDVSTVMARLSNMSYLDAVVLSDYARGWLSPLMCEKVIYVAGQRKVPVIVDPKGSNIAKYAGCDLICPSEEEAASTPFIRGEPVFPHILFKRGARGMALIEGRSGKPPVEIPAVARHVYDVTGAGDTVVAVVAAAVAAGASYLEAAQLAALAAGYVVGEVGTTVCPLEKLKELVYARN